jgi:chemotaxis protein MotB
VRETGATQRTERGGVESTIPAIQPLAQELEGARKKWAAAREDEDFERLRRQIDAYAQSHGLSRRIEATVARRGLVVRLLTDRVLFDSGSATLKASSLPLLGRIGQLLRSEFDHPIVVEGHTDSVPIRSAAYPTNWELSAGRATSVVRFFIRHGLAPVRLSAAGYGALHPLDSNASARGRSRNRRVEIVLTRLRSGS